VPSPLVCCSKVVMWRPTVVLLCLLCRLVGAVLLRKGGSSSRTDTGFYSYDYSRHGADWTMAICASRQRQSPIDLDVSPGAEPAGELRFGYLPIQDTMTLENNGKTYTADVSSKGYGGVNHMDQWYELMNINIHAVSEHTFAGQHEPLELHLVHKRYDSDELLIIAIPMTSPSKSLSPRPVPAPLGTYEAPPVGEPGYSALVQSFLMEQLPAVHGTSSVPTRKDAPLDLNSALKGASLYEYYGSMTAPPCAENTVWMVRSEPLTASDAQVQLLQAGIYSMNGGMGNFREVMPLNNREVRLFSTVEEEITPPADPLSTTTTTLAPVGRDAVAMKKAEDAMAKAVDAHAYVKSLEDRFLSTTTGLSETVVEQLSATIAGAARDAVRSSIGEITAAATSSAVEAGKVQSAVIKKAAGKR